MGLGDLFSAEGRKKRRLEKCIDRMNHKYVQSPDRYSAMEFLIKEVSEPIAVRSLMKRFFWTYDKTIEDRDEKEFALQGLVHMGTDAVLPELRKMLKSADSSVSWLLRLLTQLVSMDAARAMVAETLTACSGSDFERDPQKRIDFIHFLRDNPTDVAVLTLLPLLGDFSEEIRFHAADALFDLHAETARDGLLHALLEDESGRIRQRAVEGFAAMGWDVKGFSGKVEAALPEGYRLDKQGHVKAVPGKIAEAQKSRPSDGHDHDHSAPGHSHGKK